LTTTLHTISEVAEAAGLTYRHVRRLIDSGKLAAIQLPPKHPGAASWHVTDEVLSGFLAHRRKP
jgi:hypothetical protein